MLNIKLYLKYRISVTVLYARDSETVPGFTESSYRTHFVDKARFAPQTIDALTPATRTVFTWLVPVALTANVRARLVGCGASSLPLPAATSAVAFFATHALLGVAPRKFLSHR